MPRRRRSPPPKRTVLNARRDRLRWNRKEIPAASRRARNSGSRRSASSTNRWTRSPTSSALRTRGRARKRFAHARRLGGMHGENLAGKFLLQFFGPVAEEHASLVQEPDAMAPLGFVEIGGRGENGDAFGEQGIENSPEVATRHRIDAVGRLVEQDHLGSVNQRADQAELLLHPAGKVPGQTAAEIAQAGRRQQFRGALLALLAADAEEIRVEPDVFVHREVFVKAEALRHVAEVVLGALRVAHHVVAGHRRRAGVRASTPASMRSVVVFPAPSGPTRPKISPGVHVEGELVDGAHFAEALARARKRRWRDRR